MQFMCGFIYDLHTFVPLMLCQGEPLLVKLFLNMVCNSENVAN